MNLYLTNSGRLRRKDNTLLFERVTLPDETDCDDEIESDTLDEVTADAKNALPVETIDAIYIFREVTINSKLMIFLAQKHIPVHFFNYYGHHSGTYLPHVEQLSGDLVIRQAAAYVDMETRMKICRSLLDATIHNIHSVVGYYARRNPMLREVKQQIKDYGETLCNASNPNELMGIEGTVRRLYYGAWSGWLGDMKTNFQRTYHPPETPLNALVSFVNSLLYTAFVSELYRTALYPGISFLHSPQSRRFSLALDLTEPFKPIMADRMIFRLWNTHSIGDRDFMKGTNGFVLSDPSRRKILAEWDALLRDTIYLKSLDRSVSYRQLLRLDCYKLINFLLEGRDYHPFRMEY